MRKGLYWIVLSSHDGVLGEWAVRLGKGLLGGVGSGGKGMRQRRGEEEEEGEGGV